MVAEGHIDYAISDENVALVNKTYYNNLDVSLPVSFHQNLAWAVDKEDTELLKAIDIWLKEFKTTNRYAILYKNTSRIIVHQKLLEAICLQTNRAPFLHTMIILRSTVLRLAGIGD